MHLFHAAAGDPPALRKRADPDIVVFQQDGQVLVVDVKYRKSGENPSEEQLYQLAAHAAAYRADAAALFVPILGEGSEHIQRYGRLADGCSVDVVAVRANNATLIAQAVVGWLESVSARKPPEPASMPRGFVRESSFVGATT